jgi:hypothetical protein
MQNIIYNLTKDILEETPFVSFEADDKAMTFTCNSFDRPIVLNITNERIEPDPFKIDHQIRFKKKLACAEVPTVSIWVVK